MNLPPLPDPGGALFEFRTRKAPFAYHTADDLREYGALCRRMALEEAAKVCDNISINHLNTYKHNPGPNAYDPHFQGLSMGAGECADKIRELLK